MFWMLLLHSFAFCSLFGTENGQMSETDQKKQLSVATFAGGCFWCMQPAFDNLKGVAYTKAGYTGGHTKNPTYEQVSAGNGGHFEAVQVFYDPHVINYNQLLDAFWHNIDPANDSGQFCDKGNQYRSVIFYANENEKWAAEESKNQLLRSGRFKDIYTEILPASEFYSAEDYHQNYYLKNPIRYKFYRYMCGRDKRLKEVWGKDY